MTLLVAMVEPPREGLVLPRLADTSPLTPAETVGLYREMTKDLLRAGMESGGDVLVNYRPDDLLPEPHVRERSSEDAVRELVAEVLDDDELDGTRFEVQVGSNYEARVGNTVTHLLEAEDESSVAVAEPVAPLLDRSALDAAAMKLRRRDVVLGPAGDGRVHYAAFGDPIDFAGAYAVPEVETLTARARDADLDVDFVPPSTAVRTGADLRTLIPRVASRRRAGRSTPAHTAAFLADLPVHVTEEAGERTLVRK
ncbi:hypothetical protein J2752_000427 [Halarchaeum rubridurum]|uniref:DUF2064 domain-containing protein n=1 Tax=Halarchaeum rubridurum TaxID=489911 RepID=A0A830FME2_9EURY|nr:hypothetical protein [Halarchaeum rubridurum]MBP1953546.1 hypothetical protein [Halarchaeum rubridurum]GGM64450.1 hypothetical protein GCM10009017_13140 [Halarchaeum rubridurum]